MRPAENHVAVVLAVHGIAALQAVRTIGGAGAIKGAEVGEANLVIRSEAVVQAQGEARRVRGLRDLLKGVDADTGLRRHRVQRLEQGQ